MTQDPRRDSKVGYRPDLEGLRGVAIVLVLLYHAGLTTFEGGFVGVDVFFVLSGFLITGIIARELGVTGTVSLTRFYARRARRLLPASALVLVVTLGASALLLPAFRLPTIALDVGSAALYVSNVRFAVAATDYFAASDLPSPVLHFWSLSLEEQFYLFWPAILLVAHRLGGMRLLRLGVVGVGVSSLVGCVLLTADEPAWAFYLLPTRAWELALGGLVALSLPALSRLPRLVAGGAVLSGIGAIAFAALTFSGTTMFPGLAAMIPAGGSALVIAGGAVASTPITLMLATRPLRFLGRISYSLYLWHWPLLVIPAGMSWAGLSLHEGVLLSAAAIPLAWLTTRLVEEPFRDGRILARRPRRDLLLAAGVTAALALVAVAPTAPGGGRAVAVGTGSSPAASPGPEGLVPALADIDMLTDRGWCDTPEDPDACVYGDADAGTVVVLYGDSHAKDWLPALERLGTERGWRVISMVRGWCPPVTETVWHEGRKRANTECDDWRRLALARLATEVPDVVILSSIASYSLLDEAGAPTAVTAEANIDRWTATVTDAARAFRDAGAEVLLMGSRAGPGLPHAATCIAGNLADPSVCSLARADWVPDWIHPAEQAIADAVDGHFVDPTPWLCDESRCPVVIDRYVVLRDHVGHFVVPFAERLAGPLGIAIDAALGPGWDTLVPSPSPGG